MESFNELSLSPLLLQGITQLGFEKPSPIQAQALPILLGEPTDFIGLAATGTGKTAAFSLPFLEKIDPKKKGVQVLVLCPTRELALQVAGQVTLMGKPKGIKALPIYGGSSYTEQMHGLRQGASVVVGTPGRIVDHMERGTLVLSGLQTIVLDEADEMISMGFKEELEKILAASPRENCKIWLFSATMSREIRTIADEYLKDPKLVQVNRTEMLSGTVEQIYYLTHEGNKPEVLCKLIDMADNFYGVVFCQTKSLVTDLTQYLLDRGYKVDCLHGDKDQSARERTMSAFRNKKVNMLVCTDVASRGIDVKDITHVINYSLPRELDNYVHRIGRTARSGKSGFAMSLVTPSHRSILVRIEKMTKTRMTEGRIPNRKEIATKKVSKLLETFKAQSVYPKAVELMDQSWEDAIASLPAEEVAGRFLAMILPEVFAEFSKSAEASMTDTHEARASKRSEPSQKRERRSEERGSKAHESKEVAPQLSEEKQVEELLRSSIRREDTGRREERREGRKKEKRESRYENSRNESRSDRREDRRDRDRGYDGGRRDRSERSYGGRDRRSDNGGGYAGRRSKGYGGGGSGSSRDRSERSERSFYASHTQDVGRDTETSGSAKERIKSRSVKFLAAMSSDHIKRPHGDGKGGNRSPRRTQRNSF